ncbi:hypothetical protein HRI_004159700 [Hibiscus trionum]|uniref:Uncharacterized protein n=1 Tax=Hibiscus trionum TaxID=183268 RepID=A0A9W7IZU2_HIBTR|nr:hypothetical protein HRI_004159700 [Hibiscus trionum]
MRMPTAKMRIVKRTKKRRVWITMALPLVWKLPNSNVRLFPGSWKRRPGESSMKSNSPITIGAQSFIATTFRLIYASSSFCCKLSQSKQQTL